MGDAKKRGTFEERRAAALAKVEKDRRPMDQFRLQGPSAPGAPRFGRLARLLIASTRGR